VRPAIARALAGSVLAAGALAGCASASHPAANPAATQSAGTQSTGTQSAADQSTATLSATAAAQDQACSEQAAWDRRGQAALKALYADTGALSADAAAGNAPAVTKAGRKLASDAIAAAALPLPPVDPASWRALTADYAAAGTAIAGGDASGAVPQLEAGNGAISAFSAAAGKCAT
jgi:hypothetical protein